MNKEHLHAGYESNFVKPPELFTVIGSVKQFVEAQVHSPVEGSTGDFSIATSKYASTELVTVPLPRRDGPEFESDLQINQLKTQIEIDPDERTTVYEFWGVLADSDGTTVEDHDYRESESFGVSVIYYDGEFEDFLINAFGLKLASTDGLSDLRQLTEEAQNLLDFATEAISSGRFVEVEAQA